MDQTFTCVLLLLSLSAAFGKYVYIEKRVSRHDAQEHCRLFHTDLAPISGAHDIQRLRKLVGNNRDFVWIGLERNSTDGEKWTWSGGGMVSTFYWARGEPQSRPLEDYGVMRNYMWHDSTADYEDPFLCYGVVVVRERKTWEEALEHCREHHHDLASVASETEMLLIQKELHKNDTTDHVWIGLHFFPGGWLWVDGQPLDYEAWGQEGESVCPGVKMKCAALQRGSNGTDSTLVSITTVGVNDAAGVKESVWEAHDCEKRLHFICY